MAFRQLKPAVAVRGPHHRDVDSDAVEPIETVHPTSLDRRLALQVQTKFAKERNSSLKVVDDDAHVVHPLNRHGWFSFFVARPVLATGVPRTEPAPHSRHPETC